jgi:hypothetical protein
MEPRWPCDLLSILMGITTTSGQLDVVREPVASKARRPCGAPAYAKASARSRRSSKSGGGSAGRPEKCTSSAYLTTPRRLAQHGPTVSDFCTLQRSQVRASARCGQPAASVSKNGLQAFPSTEAQLSSQAPRTTSLSNRSLTNVRITQAGVAFVRHAPEGRFSGRRPRRRGPDVTPSKRSAATARTVHGGL